ncbi:hypothetical protein CHARACLAT_005587 [Characodon lateralis]|uniref:Uncharacterized protein n=1 Tax=Characodon lateralis TaxID=208331 RepID=A0ABU7F0E2_9TELE|nr:hypothetical protein [Characodon lateralis]
MRRKVCHERRKEARSLLKSLPTAFQALLEPVKSKQQKCFSGEGSLCNRGGHGERIFFILPHGARLNSSGKYTEPPQRADLRKSQSCSSYHNNEFIGSREAKQSISLDFWGICSVQKKNQRQLLLIYTILPKVKVHFILTNFDDIPFF